MVGRLQLPYRDPAFISKLEADSLEEVEKKTTNRNTAIEQQFRGESKVLDVGTKFQILYNLVNQLGRYVTDRIDHASNLRYVSI